MKKRREVFHGLRASAHRRALIGGVIAQALPCGRHSGLILPGGLLLDPSLSRYRSMPNGLARFRYDGSYPISALHGYINFLCVFIRTVGAFSAAERPRLWQSCLMIRSSSSKKDW
jgi:hypothetical protein